MSAVLDRPVAGLQPDQAELPPPAPDRDPGWVRPCLLVLLGASAALQLWDLAASGWANAFYAAAAQAGSQSWTAFFYGSSDAANAITVDKPPASLWVMGLSVRLFGLNPWSLLVPQALMGVATTGLVFLAVRRVAGPGAGLLAGAVMATTPVAVLMFRFDNPDALLVLLLTAAAYLMTRALQSGRRATLVGVGVLIGAAFLTKTLQAFLVVPGFALVWLVCAPVSFRRRLVDLLWAGLAVVAAGGWWVAVVELVPADWRPYVGGSQDDSVWQLIWGYNGLGRLTGAETGSVGGGAGWGETGLGRLFDVEIGGQIAWLLPAALVLGVAGLVVLGRARRTDVRRSALLVWLAWLLVTGLVFSLMAGIFHAYYTVALAPAVAAVTGIGGGLLWALRDAWWARGVLAVVLAGTGAWSWVLLGRTPEFVPWLAPAVLAVALVAALGLLVVHLHRTVAVLVLTAAAAAALGGPTAYAVQTAGTAYAGSIVTAGPDGVTGTGRNGHAPGAPRPDTGHPPISAHGTLIGASDPGPQVVEALHQNASTYTWVAAAVGSQVAAGYQLASGDPVMALGGFNGSDPTPTLAQFQRDVAEGDVHWFVAGSIGRSGSGSDDAEQIAAWVERSFPATTVDGIELYDLTRAVR
ncbi:4-amino-4-deoxy-L-arabinose transferase [Klenkia marina]|uniref:4-amino-4-deoxy-L-arabinose transferase n=1 Tax=Klenkia marina TaxID=1960309 RepID=A0A1G4XAR7_9ACTN|nr:arabinofuranosyltransferase [Klenkia marina]SCX38014.1 4-amino-4-deoxy-L-arabinose transferase [Klenkia marina]